MLTDDSGYSTRHLMRQFHLFLKEEPPLCLLPPTPIRETFLLADGLWLKRWYVVMVYRRSKDLTILHLSIAGKEAASVIGRDLQHLKEERQFRFTGIVSDGGRGIVNAIQTVFPHTPHQICMAHMHRDAVSAMGRRPRDLRIQELKNLADHMWLIESREALSWWRKQVLDWHGRNYRFLLEHRRDDTGRWWYVHKGARRAYRILTVIPYTSFTFLSLPLMPKTTNELEAQFGHFGKRWLIHRGLKTERWEHFMKWFVYFYNLHKLSQSKVKKD